MRRGLHLFFTLALAVQLQAQYTTVGTDSTFDVLTWNIENFPKNGSTTVSEVAGIVSALQVDAIAVQEIASVADFNALLSQLPGWSGILSSHEYSPGNYQKVGLLYDAQKVTVDSYQLLFGDNAYAFPRPPMEFFLSAAEGDYWFDLRLIVVHLKAFEGEENEARRRAAIESLKVYIDEEMQSGDELDFILLGDFNDHLEDPPEDNVFTVMLEDSENYTFLTEALAGIQGSYIGLNEPNLIDHICITADALNEYGGSGSTQVLYLDDQNPDYEAMVSDHRPVFAQFAFDEPLTNDLTAIRDIHENFASYEGQVVTINGVVTLGVGILSTTYTSAYVQDTSQAGIYIYYSSGIISDLTQGTQVELSGQVYNYNGLHEIIYQSHRVTGLNQPLPDPFAISTNSINNTDENPGRWIEVQGSIESISGTSNITMMINDGSGAGKVYFDANAGFDVAEFSVGEQIKITGVKTVYNYEGEVVPGYQEDIQKVNPSSVWERGTRPRGIYLYPNYPNPFNPVTAISYQLGVHDYAPVRVELNIYNLVGQKVASLVSERQAAGYYTVQWDASDQAGGVYIIRLDTGDGFVQSRKILLLK